MSIDTGSVTATNTDHLALVSRDITKAAQEKQNAHLANLGHDFIGLKQSGSGEVELDWHIEESDLTKLFADAKQREEVRRLLDAAKNEKGKFTDTSRRKLAQIKLDLNRPKDEEIVRDEGPDKDFNYQQWLDRKMRSEGGWPD